MSCRRHRLPPTRQHRRGIALPAVVFIMVVMGLLIAGGLNLLMQANQSHVQQLLAARAISAARSGVEWGLWQVSATNGSAPAACFSTTTLTLPEPLANINLSVSCTRTPATGTVDEGGLKLATFSIAAIATHGSQSDPLHVSRQMEARHTVCRNPGADSPAFRC
jgi:MSHA biogenesis protein MshP